MGDSNEIILDQNSSTEDDSSIPDNYDSDFVPDPASVNEEIPNTIRKSGRQPKLKKFEDYVSYLCLDSDSDPVCVEDAMSKPDCEFWIAVMKDELKSFEENAAWETTDFPKNGCVVKCKWVYKRKNDD